MVRWELHGKHPSTSFGKIVRRHVGASDAQNVDSMISAYETLWKGKFQSADAIRRAFTRDGQPLFTPAQAESVFRKIRSTQKGGERVDSILNSTIRKGVDMAAGLTPPSPPNPAIESGLKMIQMAVRMVIPFIFILDTLENTPLFGDLIGAALDVTAAVLPVIASTIQTTTPGLVGLIPIPLAGTVGILLGWLFSLCFLWLAMVIGISRKEFAAALEATAGMAPVIGPALSRGVKAAETVGTKFYNRSDKIMASISKAFGSLQGAVEKVKSTVNSLPSADKIVGTNPPLLPSLSEIKKSALSAVPAMPVPAGEDPTPPPPTASAPPPPPPAPKVSAPPPPKASAPPPLPPPRKKGGRFTRRRRSINKQWKRKTTRRRQ
jgi:hypothetical protein